MWVYYCIQLCMVLLYCPSIDRICTKPWQLFIWHSFLFLSGWAHSFYHIRCSGSLRGGVFALPTRSQYRSPGWCKLAALLYNSSNESIYDMYGCMHASFYLPAQINDDGCSISSSNSTYLLCTFSWRVSMYVVIFISIFLSEVIFGLLASSMSLLGRVHGTLPSTALLIMTTSRPSRFSYTGGQTDYVIRLFYRWYNPCMYVPFIWLNLQAVNNGCIYMYMYVVLCEWIFIDVLLSISHKYLCLFFVCVYFSLGPPCSTLLHGMATSRPSRSSWSGGNKTSKPGPRWWWANSMVKLTADNDLALLY